MNPIFLDLDLGGGARWIVTSFHALGILGFLLGGGLWFFLLRKQIIQRPIGHFVSLLLIIGFGAVSARIVQALVELGSDIPPNLIEQANTAGATISGGLPGAVVAIALIALLDRRRILTWRYLDALAVAFPLAHGISRVGCWFNGCCYGGICEASNPLAVSYPSSWYASVSDPTVPLGPRWPSPLIEAAGLGLIALGLGVLFYLAARHHKKMQVASAAVPAPDVAPALDAATTQAQVGADAPPARRDGGLSGSLGVWYLLAYAVLRFFQEFTRGDLIRGGLEGLSTGQVSSILVAVLGIAYFVWWRMRGRGRPWDAAVYDGRLSQPKDSSQSLKDWFMR